MILASIAMEIVLSILCIFYLFLMCLMIKIEPDPYRVSDLKNLRRDIFIWSLFPLSLGALGAARLIDLHFYFVFRDFAFTAMVSLLSFMLVINLDHYTEYRFNRSFTVSFVIISSIGTGTIFAIVRFFSDKYFDTGFLGGNTHLMVYLIMIVILGISIGINLRDYIEIYEFFPIENVGAEFEIKDGSVSHRKEFFITLNHIFGTYDNRYAVIISRVLQVFILIIVIYGFYIGRSTVIGWSIFSFIFAISPDILRINVNEKAPSIIYIWFAIVTFTYAFGRPMGFYRLFVWWAEVTHFLAGSLVAILVFSFLVYINRISQNLHIPYHLILLIPILSVFTVGVVWEISEFYFDIIFDRRIQSGLDDTVLDIFSNFLGSLFSIFIVMISVPSEILDED